MNNKKLQELEEQLKDAWGKIGDLQRERTGIFTERNEYWSKIVNGQRKVINDIKAEMMDMAKKMAQLEQELAKYEKQHE